MKTKTLLVEARHVERAIAALDAQDCAGVAKVCPLLQAAKEAGIVVGWTAGVGSSVLYRDWPGAPIPFFPPLPEELYAPGAFVNHELNPGWAWRRALEYAALEPYRFELEEEGE